MSASRIFLSIPTTILLFLAILFSMPVSVSAASCVSISNYLTVGATDAQTNGEVSKLQDFLRLNEPASYSLVVSGYFDSATQSAVANWQRAQGIVSSGTPLTTGYGAVGPRTRASLTNCSRTTPSPTPLPGGTLYRNLSYGSFGPDVSTLQTVLSTDVAIYPERIISGFYGRLTEAAVQRFQVKYGIVSYGSPLTTGFGAVGPRTRAILLSLPPIYVPPSSSSCVIDGTMVSNGASSLFYSQREVTNGSSCNTYSQVRTCTNGSLSGSYQYASCRVITPGSCSFNGATLTDGQSVTAYQSASVSIGGTCVFQTRTCTNGVLSGTYANSSCVVSTAASCSFSGASVASGSSVTAYQSATVAYGNTCTSQSRTCTNGTLSGTYTNSSCQVATSSDISFLSQPKAAPLILYNGREFATRITQTSAFGNTASTVGYIIGDLRYAYYVLAAGVIATTSEKATLLDKGLRVFEWGLADMEPDGSFPNEPSTPIPSYKGIHRSGFFVEAAARSVLLILNSDVDATYKARATALIPKLRQAALYMAEPTNLDDFFANNVYANQKTTVATAFAEVGKLSNDATLTNLARVRMAQIIANQTPEGVFLERGGFDASYQTVSLRFIATYATLLAPGVERQAVIASMQKGWNRFLQNVSSNGTIDDSDSTRTVACGEPIPGPGPKGYGIDTMALSLYYFGYLTKQFAMYSPIADSIEIVGQRFAHIEHCQREFFDAGDGSTGAWSNLYFKDGATSQVTNTPNGLLVSSPTSTSTNNDHLVLWTKKKFTGPIRVTFAYKRLDTPPPNGRASLVILHSKGVTNEPCPVDGITRTTTDIQTWSRPSPSYGYYHECMDNQSVNFDSLEDGILRVSFRQNRDFNSLSEFTSGAGLQTNVWYKVEIIRSATNLVVNVKTTSGVLVYTYTSSTFLPSEILSNDGYLGFRTMSGRQALYQNISVYSIDDSADSE